MGKLDALWQYQEAQLIKERLEQTLRNTPARTKLNKLRGFLSEQQQAIAKLKQAIEQREAELEHINDQVVQLEKKIELEVAEFSQMQSDEECTAEEFTECKKNLEALQNELNTLRRTLQDLIQWIEQTAKEYVHTRNKAGKAKKEYDALRVVCDEEYATYKDKIDNATREMEEKAKLVDGDLLERYQKVKQNHAVPMAKVEHNQCSGCYMSLPMVVVKRVASHEGIVECENCGRILYTCD